jgi:hypothetical protein
MIGPRTYFGRVFMAFGFATICLCLMIQKCLGDNLDTETLDRPTMEVFLTQDALVCPLSIQWTPSV